MTIKRYTYLIIYVLAATFLAACSSNEPELDENGYGPNVKVKVGLTTRATGVPETTFIENELIKDWWVIFVDNTNHIVKYIERPTPTGSPTAVEKEDFELEIRTGDYTAYSFANITKAQVETAIGGSDPLAVGNTMPDLTAITFDVSSLNGTSEGAKAIPMSSKPQAVRFASGGMQFIELEVVRMVAKMEFQFKNESPKDLAIKKLTINRVENPNVLLLPNYTWLNDDDGWQFSNLGTASDWERSYSPVNLTMKGGTAPTYTDKFYMVESMADFSTPSQNFIMSLDITRNGKDEQLHFMLDKTTNNKRIQTIYRNDHVVIPLTISDYAIGLDASSYPPIGGYPEATVVEDEDLEAFYCTFNTQGVFSIKPVVYRASTGTNVMYGDWVYLDWSTTDKFLVEGDLFVLKDGKPDLTVDSSTGEIIGKLNTTIGTACISVKIKIVATGQYYIRRIFIKHQ